MSSWYPIIWFSYLFTIQTFFIIVLVFAPRTFLLLYNSITFWCLSEASRSPMSMSFSLTSSLSFCFSGLTTTRCSREPLGILGPCIEMVFWKVTFWPCFHSHCFLYSLLVNLPYSTSPLIVCMYDCRTLLIHHSRPTAIYHIFCITSSILCRRINVNLRFPYRVLMNTPVPWRPCSTVVVCTLGRVRLLLILSECLVLWIVLVFPAASFLTSSKLVDRCSTFCWRFIKVTCHSVVGELLSLNHGVSCNLETYPIRLPQNTGHDTKNKGSNNQPFFSPLVELVTTDVGRARAIFRTDDSTLPVDIKTPMSEMTTPLIQKKILCIFEKFEDEYKTPQQRGQSRCIGLESHNSS